MYCQSFLVISVRGIGLPPMTAARAASGCLGAMNAAFGVRFFAFLAGAFFARFTAFFPPFLAAFLPFFAAILSPGRWNGWGCRPLKIIDFPYENARSSGPKSI